MSRSHYGGERPHRTTTRNLCGAYPFLAEAGLGHEGIFVGYDIFGGAFMYDPFHLYGAGLLTNPNMIVFGQIGRGKSALMKTYLYRQAALGRRIWVVDPKGEYEPLASALGTTTVKLVPGGSVRLNPLDDPKGSPGTETARRRLALLGALAAACLRRDLQPRERAALELALDQAASTRPPTIPDVIECLLEPAPTSARSIYTEVARLREDGRDVALELRRLVFGDLRSMFDGPTTAGIDLGAKVVVLDLSALYHSDALGIVMTCATAFLQNALESVSSRGQQVFMVVDEAWAILANLSVARWLRSSWKLSRSFGVANVAVLHRCSDLGAVGAQFSEQVALAQGLLSDSETRIIYAQSPGEIDRARELLSLSDTEAALVPGLRRGIGLWKVGPRSFLVQHRIGRLERELVDTDVAMRPLS